MCKIKAMFSFIMDIDYFTLFSKQISNIINFIDKSGLFNENIYFLLKIMPLMDVNSENFSILKELFIVVLDKFPNCFTDEVFDLIILFIDKFEQHIDENLFYVINNAIINKYSYKGLNLVKLNNKFYKIIFESDIYFSYFKNSDKHSLISFNLIIGCRKSKLVRWICKIFIQNL